MSRNMLNRRKFMGGASVLVGLPFLEALAPQSALGQAGAAPKRFMGYFSPNGFDMADWRPVGSDGPLQLGPMMGGAAGRVWNDGLGAYPAAEDGPGMEDLIPHLLVLSGLTNTKQDSDAGDHAGGIGAFMTNRTVPKAPGGTMMGPSIDYLLSTVIGTGARRPYFLLGGEAQVWAGDGCDSGYPCSVGNHITFDMQGVNVPRLESPGQAYDQLFEGFDGSESSAAAAERWARQSSVLDVVRSDTESLITQISYQDRSRLERYLTSVREVEMRIAALSASGGTTVELPPRPDEFDQTVDGIYYGATVHGNHREAIDISHQLFSLAFITDATRVASYMWGNMTSSRNYEFIGAVGGHHNVSHHGGSAENVAYLKRVGHWEYRRFAEFLRSLKDADDVDGRTVLDNTLVFQSSDISDGDAHNHDDMPVVLAGGAAGFTMGRHLDRTGNTFGDLFVSIAQAYGMADVTEFGETGTGPLPGLTT